MATTKLRPLPRQRRGRRGDFMREGRGQRPIAEGRLARPIAAEVVCPSLPQMVTSFARPPTFTASSEKVCRTIPVREAALDLPFSERALAATQLH